MLLRELKDKSLALFLRNRGQILLNKCETFPLALYRNGRLIVSGGCFVHVVQYQHYYFVEYRLDQTWVGLPRGKWLVQDALRFGDGRGTGGNTQQSSERLAVAGGITVRGVLGGTGGRTLGKASPQLVPRRLACGLFVGHPVKDPRRFQPAMKAFATISWPSFRLIGMNRPLSGSLRDGGLFP